MKPLHILALCAVLALGACAANQVSGTLLSSYDGAVAAEEAALATGKISPAEATKLRALRVEASRDVLAVVAAEANGGTASASVQNIANGAIAALLTEATAAKGS